MAKDNYPFHKLSQKQLQEGAELGLLNTKDLVKASETCADNNLHAPGNSLLISAAEELIKSLYLRVYAVTGNEPIKNFQALFFKHNIKHEKIITQAIIQLQNQIESRSKEEQKNINLGLLIVSFFILIVQSFKGPHDRNSLSIEESRTAGLYLDFHKTNLNWLVPRNEINIESFEYFLDLLIKNFSVLEQEYFSENSEEAVIKLFYKLQELNNSDT